MAAARRVVSSGSPFELRIGFSRAVRAGPYVSVSGTAPLDEAGRTVAPGDVYGQTRRCLEITIAALAELGAAPQDVVRTRLMLTNIDRWRDAARAHGEFFGAILPACTLVEVSRFIDADWLIETEADAVVS
jgi:enamine deaminase RidA (YjgF/YER057c/UK114 family)